MINNLIFTTHDCVTLWSVFLYFWREKVKISTFITQQLKIWPIEPQKWNFWKKYTLVTHWNHPHNSTGLEDTWIFPVMINCWGYFLFIINPYCIMHAYIYWIPFTHYKTQLEPFLSYWIPFILFVYQRTAWHLYSNIPSKQC